MLMKKFRFLVFMLILTSIFIGCAQPTDDTVIPEVPKTTTEEDNSEVSDAQLIEAICANFGESKIFYFNGKITNSNRFFIKKCDEGYTEISENDIINNLVTCFEIGQTTVMKHESYNLNGNIKIKSVNMCKDELIEILTWLLNNGKIKIKK